MERLEGVMIWKCVVCVVESQSEEGCLWLRFCIYADFFFAMKCDDNVYDEPLLSIASVPLHKRDTPSSASLFFPRVGPRLTRG